MALFFVVMLSMFLFIPFEAERSKRTCGELDLLQLDRKSHDPANARHSRGGFGLRKAERPLAPAAFSLGFSGFFVLHLLTMLLMLALMPFYIILAVKNERLDQTMRIIWVVLLCTLGLLANPVYWFLYVWRKPGSNELLNGTVLNQRETI